MSQVRQPTASDLTEGYPVTSLTLVVLLLIPCVVILLLLNCLFLGYKLLLLSKGRWEPLGDADEMLLLSTLQRARGAPDGPLPDLQGERRAYASLSEPVMPHPVTSSRASSRDRAAADHRIRLLRPDGTAGSGSLRAPSTIRAPSSAPGFTPRFHLAPSSRTNSNTRSDWPVLPQTSHSESRGNVVPPNSPMETQHVVGHVQRTSSCDILSYVNQSVAAHPFDKVDMECELTNPLPSDTSSLNMSAVGPGLDSDFGASAGVSLRILSADSDGLSNGVLSSALEWDYYDPCYVRQNNLPKHKHHRPVMHTKQYWV